MMEAVVLAGGMGTRLRSVVSDVPKPMAPVGGRPFLESILDWLASCGIRSVVLSVGYKWEVIRDRFGSSHRGMELEYAVEDRPLGTGGAVALALRRTRGKTVFVVNGDTSFRMDLGELGRAHERMLGGATLALKEMFDFDRYGTVDLGVDGRVLGFREKAPCVRGLINAGVYALDRGYLDGRGLPERFSLEKDVFEAQAGPQGSLRAAVYDVPFLDIGIPEDYARAEAFLERSGA